MGNKRKGRERKQPQKAGRDKRNICNLCRPNLMPLHLHLQAQHVQLQRQALLGMEAARSITSGK
uniref:Uncharacterized protein n=1 Tax=Arundo donax TaxID=35708 RepID=A0A0A9AWY4_ARUDO